MKYGLRSLAWLIGAASVAAQAPPPVIQNGRVETRPGTNVDALIRQTVPSSLDPVWVGWQEPLVDGGRRACSTWSDADTTIRGTLLESREGNDGRPQLTPVAGPAQLESGTTVVVLVRVVEGRVERLRSISDDCPIDANGRTVEWLPGISAAESLRFLGALAQPSVLTADARRLAQSAASAIALHRDPGADGILERLTTADTEAERDNAWRLLSGYRGHHGYDLLSRAIASERTSDARQRLVSALRQSSDPAASTTLLALAKTDPSEHVRAEAIVGYATLTGIQGIAQVMEIATRDSSPEVQRRAVTGISRLPQASSVPALLTLARTSPLPAVRKEAVGALSRVDDPRARAYLEDLVRN